MNVTEYEQILDYLSSQQISLELKYNRYQRNNFVGKCKGVSLQNNKLMTVKFLIIYSTDKLFTDTLGNIRLSRRRIE